MLNELWFEEYWSGDPPVEGDIGVDKIVNVARTIFGKKVGGGGWIQEAPGKGRQWLKNQGNNICDFDNDSRTVCKEIQKIGNEWKTHKQDIITAMEEVESRIDKRLTILKEQIEEVNKNVLHLYNWV